MASVRSASRQCRDVRGKGGRQGRTLAGFIQFLFAALDYRKFLARIIEGNLGSIQVFEKNGFKLVGTMRHHRKIRGTYHDRPPLRKNHETVDLMTCALQTISEGPPRRPVMGRPRLIDPAQATRLIVRLGPAPRRPEFEIPGGSSER